MGRIPGLIPRLQDEMKKTQWSRGFGGMGGTHYAKIRPEPSSKTAVWEGLSLFGSMESSYVSKDFYYEEGAEACLQQLSRLLGQ
jgi:hypothetical protein